MDIRKYKDDTIYRQKFDDYEVELPVDDWAVFSRKLAAAQPKRRRFAFYYIAAAASVVGILLLGVSYLNHNGSSGSLQLVKQNIAQANEQLPTTSSSNTFQSKKKDQEKKQAQALAKGSTHGTIAESHVKPNGHEVTYTIPDQTTDKTKENSKASSEQSANQQTIASANSSVNNFDTTGYITHPVPQYAELPALPADNSNSEDKNGNGKKSTGSNNLVKWLAGTFQGNLGLTSGAGGSLTSDGSIGSQLFNRVSQAELLSSASSSAPSLMSFSGKKTYYLPISFGISVGMPLSKRWELQSGLTYTRLTTTGELGAQYTGGARSTGRIEQHYLGIPVSLAYSFIQKPAFAVYLIGGGRIEKGLSLVERIYTYNSQNTPVEQEHYRYSINGVQLSLDAGIGASYRLYRFLHWYVETGGAWYIPCNQPESSRTEHPLNVSLKTGVKFSLYK